MSQNLADLAGIPMSIVKDEEQRGKRPPPERTQAVPAARLVYIDQPRPDGSSQHVCVESGTLD